MEATMGKRTGIIMFAVLACSLHADPVNITQYDGEGSGTGWYGSQEDQEVSNGCVANQNWDLEAFMLDGSSLSLIGGYDFRNGRENFDAGDIFIDVDNNAQYGTTLSSSITGEQVVANTFGWDYVLDLHMDNLTYDVYSLTPQSEVVTVHYSINADANPWRYASGGALVTSGVIDYVTGLTNDQTGMTGGSHNMLTVDLAFLDHGQDFTAHNAIQCGNDNIIGKGTVSVPEPGIYSLFVSGFLLLSFVGISTKRKK